MLRRSTKGLLLLVASWIIMATLMFCVASKVLGMADTRSTFDDCQGSPMPDDMGNGCTHGGLDNGRM